MIALKIIATIAIGYFLGIIHPSYFVALFKKIDIKRNGTMNYGAGNTFIVAGKGWGVFVAIFDIGKGALATLLPMWIFPGIFYLQFVGGCMAVIGHIFPFYLKFNGGKGFAAFIGMMLAINWIFGLIALASMIVIMLIVNYRLATTMTIILSFPIFVAVYYREWIGFACVMFTTCIIIYKHIPNFVKIFNGEENTVWSILLKKKKLKDDLSIHIEEEGS